MIHEGKVLDARAFRALWPIIPGYFTTAGSPDRRTIMAFDTEQQLDAWDDRVLATRKRERSGA